MMKCIQVKHLTQLAFVACLWPVYACIAQGTFVVPSANANRMGGDGAAPIMPGPGTDNIPYRYQQVFGANDMTLPYGVYYLTGVSFRLVAPVAGSSSLNAVVPDIEMRLSTTYTVVDHLSSFFANNTGSDEAVVIPRGPLQVTGTYVPGQAVQPFSVHVSFAEPFLFNHSPEKNLLLDIINYKGSSLRVAMDGAGIPGDSVSSVAYNRLSEGVGLTTGLIAQFEYRAVPEPSVTALLGMGSCGLFIMGRRRINMT